MRKRWLVIPVVVLALAIAVAAGAVLAQSTGDADGSKSFVGRVAETLGLEEDTVADAMKQAWQEMHEERLQARLDALVESGRITQEQADEYKTWLDSRPEGVGPLSGKGFGRHHGLHGRGFKWDKDADTSDSGESDTDSTST